MFLRKLKKLDRLTLVVLLFILLVLPFYIHVYHVGLYYIVVVFIFIPLLIYRILINDSLEEDFYAKWGKKREKGRLFNILSGGLQAMSFMLAIAFASQFFINGLTPSFILAKMPVKGSLGLMAFVIILSLMIGNISWHENEKRYVKSLYKTRT